MKDKKMFVCLIVVICVVAAGLIGFCIGLALQQLKTTTNTVSTNVNAVTNANLTNITTPVNTNTVVNTNTAITVIPVTDAGVTWITPVTVGDLKLLAADDQSLDGISVTYQKIGTTSAGDEIIYAEIDWQAPSAGSIARFLKNAKGEYSILSKYSVSEAVSHIVSSVSVDSTTDFKSLDFPYKLTVSGIDLISHPLVFPSSKLLNEYEASQTDEQTITTLGQSPYGTVMTATRPLTDPNSKTGSGLASKSYILELADGSMQWYVDAKDFLNDDGSLDGSFEKNYSDFSTRTFQIGIVADGCGAPQGDQIDTVLVKSSLTSIGGTPSEDQLFTATDANLPVLKVAYDAYNIGRGYNDSDPIMSYADFVAAKPLLFWQDQAGDLEVFMDSSFAALVECGKPVVYLYPTTTTDVSVQVAAKVTKSEPTYAGGWQVTAQPNGVLTTANGQVYSNLFWEGKGAGSYPAITQGRVVAKVNIESALRADLAAQGLNAQETQDFLDFWLPRMPNTPFVRLTWLGTQAMNQLAPLTVSPAPQTVLRVFLDFSGQQTATTDLASQTLHTTPRVGFTLVEWGGLLRGE